MGKIAIEGMRFYAYHGFYPQEQLIGNEFLVDIYVQAKFDKASSDDDLGGTINYETLYRISKLEMQRKSKLLEHVGQRIVERIKSIFEQVEAVHLRIRKLNPPLGGVVASASIEIEEKYWVSCGKCKKNFLSHKSGDCWTKHGLLYEETKNTLQKQYGKNMCKACLKPHLLLPPPSLDEEPTLLA